MEGLARGASMVSTPSGDREEVTFSMSAVEGRLEGSDTIQLSFTVSQRITPVNVKMAPVLMKTHHGLFLFINGLKYR